MSAFLNLRLIKEDLMHNNNIKILKKKDVELKKKKKLIPFQSLKNI